MGGEHRLVTLGVFRGVGVFDIGRQRHMAVAFHQRQWVGGKAQVEQRPFRSGTAQHLGVEGVGEAHPAARPRRFAGAQVGQHLVAGQHPFHQGFHRAAGGLLAQGEVEVCDRVGA